ncbi:MAG: lysophospholipid acyltransferase family protein [bacterium]|nr:lysophospholipid acyltransferase family protein [bacterium]
MSTLSTVQEYVARQPSFGWRRAILRGLIRSIGFTLLCRVEVTGAENVPTSGPIILMMSHISAIDPIVCMGVVKQRYIIPMTKIENTENPLLRFFVWWWGAYTVRREEVDRTALLNSIELVKSGQAILIAPEGTRHPEGLGHAKDGLTYVATKADAVVVPVAMYGAVDFMQRWKRGRRAFAGVAFGRPFRFKTNGRTRIPRDELALMTQEAMYQMALAQPVPALRGVYADLDKATTETLEFVNPSAG